MAKSPNSILWVVLICSLSLVTKGQLNNNIFNGGTQDGYHQSAAVQTASNPVFSGGNGDGHDFSSFFPIIGNSVFAGGSGDGFHQSSFMTAVGNLIFAGGNADGHDLACYIQATNSGIYAGGNADGFDAACYIIPSGNGIFAGGIGDGFDHLHFIQPSSSLIFAGGIGDGFDHSSGFASLCSNDSVTVLAQTCFPANAGVAIQNLTNTGGCDSMVVTITSLLPSYDTLINLQTCIIGDTGTFVQAFVTVDGCDSTVTTVIILDPGSQTALPAIAICQGDSALIFGLYQYIAGNYFDTLSNQNGCDSILAQSLIVNPIDTTLQNANTNDSTMAGVFVVTLIGDRGCDSIVITTVIYQPAPCVVDSVTIYEVSCDSAMAGISIVTYAGSDDCDSVVITNTAFDPGSTTTLPDIQICDGDSAMVFGQMVALAGVYFDTLSNQNNCDSVVSIAVLVNPTYSRNITDSICSGDSLFVGGAYQTIAGVYYDTLSATNGCDSILTTMLTVRTDSGCVADTSSQGCLTVVSNNTWMKSSIVSPSNLSGFWPGSPGLPGTGTFTDPVTMGQPYNYPSIQVIENSQVISTGPSVTYFRKEFMLAHANDLDVRLLITADDQAEIFLNGQQAALISTFGRPNYKFPAHDVKFGSGVVSNGFMGGDSYDVTATAATVGGALQVGVNEVIVAVRNLGKPSDIGGFSFRMDINCDDNGIIKKTAEVSGAGTGGLIVYPNPVKDILNLKSDLAINSVRLFDLSGKLVVNMDFNAEKEVELKMDGLPAGIYLIKVSEVGSQISTLKVVKQ